MKNVIKISALVAAFAGLTLGAKAQTSTPATTSTTTGDGIRLSVGIDGGLPTGNLKNAYDWSLGGSVQADFPIVSKELYVTVNAGYNNIFGKSNINGTGIDATDIHLIPAKAGLKFFPVSNFYIQGEAGAAFALNKSDLGFDKTAAFLWAPQVGYLIPLGGKNSIDAGVRYEATTKFNSNADGSDLHYFGLRVAYSFDLK